LLSAWNARGHGFQNHQGRAFTEGWADQQIQSVADRLRYGHARGSPPTGTTQFR
jgi:hypothetical protein